MKAVPIPSRTKVVKLDLVDRDPGQPRKTFNESTIRDLATNIAANGLLNPVYLRPHPEKKGCYMLVAGERRFRALKLLETEEFEFRIVDKGLPPYVISIIENSHREGLNPIEEAESYRECMEREGMSVTRLSEYTGKHFVEIYRLLRLLKLPPEVQQLVREGKITRARLQHLSQFKGMAKQIELAQQIIRGEDPPELIEASTKQSERSEKSIIAHLPKTPEGLIRRMLRFRSDTNRIRFVIDAFLALNENEQVKGWTAFTSTTRENFVSQMKTVAQKLETLNSKMATLPETRRVPSGNAIPKSERPAPIQTAAPEPKPQKPFSAATVLGRVRSKPAGGQSRNLPDPKPRPIRVPTPREMKSGKAVLDFFRRQINNRSTLLLSKAALIDTIGNGDSPAEVEKTALAGLRAARDVWRSPPNAEDPKEVQNFVIAVSHCRYDMGDMTFSNLLQAIRSRDRSSDPINLGLL